MGRSKRPDKCLRFDAIWAIITCINGYFNKHCQYSLGGIIVACLMGSPNIIKGKWLVICEAEDCDAEARTVGLCPRHYQQVRRHGRLTPEWEYQKRSGECRVGICDEAQVAKGYCFRHYQQMRCYGRHTPERERVYGRTSCKLVDCHGRHSWRGYCKKHYMSEYYIKVVSVESARRSA